jgi:tetratricopeptide (TPR) repeat protein
MEAIIDNLDKDPLYLILTIFIATSTIILIALRTIEKRIKKKKEEILKFKHIINNNTHDKAVEYYKTIAQKYPKEPYVYYYLAISHYKAGNIQEALENFKKAEETANSITNILNPFIFKIDKTELYKEYAKALESAEKTEEAITYYKKALNQAKKSKKEKEAKAILKEISRIYKERLNYENQ